MALNDKQGRSAKVTGPIYRQIEEITKVLGVYTLYEDTVEPKYVKDLLSQLHELLDMSGTICLNDAERHEVLSEHEVIETDLDRAEVVQTSDDNLITYSLSPDVFDNIELDPGEDIEEEDED